uniref:LamG domain-containing protein n=1 Tax=Arhodomonas sp. AD133 TaxID=3415009 RepID=UPI003EC07004
GEPPSGHPDFQSTGAGEGPLAYRPANAVPMKVALYDEPASRARANALAREQRADPNADLPDDASPAYAWVYRPEMQFSVFDLQPQRLEQGSADDGTLEVIDLTDGADVPAISLDEAIRLLYGLEGSEFLPLEQLGPDRELVFSLGAEEVRAEVTDSGELVFDNPDHLTELTADDLIALRLYQGNDSENVLWEYAFETIDIVPGTDEPEIAVSADDPEHALNAYLPSVMRHEPDERPVYTLAWGVEGTGSLSTARERGTHGHYSTILELPNQAESRARVTARLGNGQAASAHSVWFEVVPGEPAEIQVTQQGAPTVGELGEQVLTVKVLDQWGNPVADGTPVSIRPGTDLAIDAPSTTTNGIVEARVRGFRTAGDIPVTIEAGAVQTQASVAVHDIELALSMPDVATPGQTVTVSVRADTPAADLSGMSVILRHNRGAFSEQTVTLDDSGTASTQYYVGGTAGPGAISAELVGRFAEQHFEVRPTGSNLQQTHSLLIGDRTVGGSVQVEDLNGDALEFAYATQTTVSVSGTPGEMVTLDLGDPFRPAIEPVLNYRMTAIGTASRPNAVPDLYGVIPGTADGVTVAANQTPEFRNAYEFDGTGTVSVDQHEALDRPDRLGFALRFRADEHDGTLVEYSQSGQRLLFEDGRLRYVVTTDTGEYVVDSGPVALEKWHEVGAHYKNERLQLFVDGKRFETAAQGDLLEIGQGTPGNGGVGSGSSTAITIGKGYHGLVAGFRIYDWRAPKLLALPGGKRRVELTVDNSGNANVVVSSTGMLGQRTVTAAGSSDLIDFFIERARAQTRPGPLGQIEYRISVKGSWGSTSLEGVVAGAGAFARFADRAGYAYVTGEVDSAGAFAGDTAASMTPLWGDGRDLAKQAYYLYFDPGRYDPIVVKLAQLGLVTDLLTIYTGGLAIGVDGTVATAKTTVKVIRKGEAAGPYLRILDKRLDDVMDRLVVGPNPANWNWDAVERTMPAVEVTLWLAYDDASQQLIAGAITNTKDFDVWVDYLLRWAEAPGSVIARVSNFLIERANAADVAVFRRRVQDLIDYAQSQGLYHSARNPDGLRLMGEHLTEALEELNDAVNRFPGTDVADLQFDSRMLRALVKLGSPPGGQHWMESLVYLGGNRLNPKVITFEELLGHLDSVNIPRLSDEDQGAGMNTVMRLLGDADWKDRQAAAHQLRGIAVAGDDVGRVEYRVTVKGAGENNELGDVVFDRFEPPNRGVDSKAWSSTEKNLIRQFKRGLGQEAEKEQILRYIVMNVVDGADNVLEFDRRSAGKEPLIRRLLWDMVSNPDKYDLPDLKWRLASSLSDDPNEIQQVIRGEYAWDAFLEAKGVKTVIDRMVTVVE